MCYDDSVNFWFRLPLRTRLGIIGSAFLVSVIVLLLLWYQDPVRFSPYRSNWILRFGPLVFLLWLAWGDIEKIPWWNWLIIVVLLIVCSIRPAFWLLGIPVIGYILFGGRKKK